MIGTLKLSRRIIAAELEKSACTLSLPSRQKTQKSQKLQAPSAGCRAQVLRLFALLSSKVTVSYSSASSSITFQQGRSSSNFSAFSVCLNERPLRLHERPSSAIRC